MSTTEYQTYSSNPQTEHSDVDIAGSFLADISPRVHGVNARRLIEPKENVRQVINDFAHGLMPQEAIEVAPIAHLAELSHHELYGKNIRKAFNESVFSNENLSDKQKTYIGAIISDLSYLANYAKTVHAEGGQTLDLETLTETINSVNIESVALKSSLDYSNFQLLQKRDVMTPKEARKMERVISSIRHIDSVLLEILGFDALAAKMLSHVYTYELEQAGESHYVQAAQQLFDSIGTIDDMGDNAETLLTDLFSHSSTMQYRVTHNQSEHGLHFTDGRVTLPETHETYRTLTRLKSVGSSAMKMRNIAQKTGEIQPPADIIGVTFVGADNNSIERILEHTLTQMDEQQLDIITAPGYSAAVHVKGSQEFVNHFTAPDSPLVLRGVSIRPEICDNGYEAVKLTTIRNNCPVEMQFTHEASRQASRTGLGSHTLFKMEKLLGIGVGSHLSKDDIVSILNDTAQRKAEFSSKSIEIVPDSKKRADALQTLCAHEASLRIRQSLAIGRVSSQNTVTVL